MSRNVLAMPKYLNLPTADRFMAGKDFQLSTWRWYQPITWRCLLSSEDIEHQRHPLETQHIISDHEYESTSSTVVPI